MIELLQHEIEMKGDPMIQKNNRREILEAAYWLFYDQGYNNTSLEDVARRCGVTKQAVSYHFGSKNGLGKEVAAMISTRVGANFEMLAKRYNPQATSEHISAAYLIWFSQAYRNDEKAFRFFREFILLDENFSDLVAYVTPAYERDISEKTADMLGSLRQMQMMSAFYSGKGLLYHYALGNLNCSEELFAQYYFSNYFENFYTDQELRSLYRKGKEILQGMGENLVTYKMALFM